MPSTLMDLYKTGGSSYVSGKEMSMKKFPQSQVVISVPPMCHHSGAHAFF